MTQRPSRKWQLPADEIAVREPVWMGLAELWLDIEFSEAELDHLAQTLAHSPYSIGQIERIYRREVVPVVWTNGVSVAGVWEGFDRDFICHSAEHRAKPRPPWTALTHWISPHHFFGRMMDPLWKHVRERVVHLRESQPN